MVNDVFRQDTMNVVQEPNRVSAKAAVTENIIHKRDFGMFFLKKSLLPTIFIREVVHVSFNASS